MAEWQDPRSLNQGGTRRPGESTYVELRNLANKNGLVLSTNQRSKTAIALGELSTTQQQ